MMKVIVELIVMILIIIRILLCDSGGDDENDYEGDTRAHFNDTNNN